MANDKQGGLMFNALTAGSKIVGNITADSDYRIDGLIEGELNCTGKVVIGEGGRVKGTIVCANAEIMGMMDGKITCHQQLSLRAQFNGTCAMGSNTLSSAEPKKA